MCVLCNLSYLIIPNIHSLHLWKYLVFFSRFLKIDDAEIMKLLTYYDTLTCVCVYIYILWHVYPSLGNYCESSNERVELLGSYQPMKPENWCILRCQLSNLSSDRGMICVRLQPSRESGFQYSLLAFIHVTLNVPFVNYIGMYMCGW
jgi:hypothetical protein